MISIRASSMGDLLDCGYRWEGKHILGITRPASAPMHLGTAIHAGTGAYDTAQVEGKPIRPADAVQVYHDTLHHPQEEVDWGGSNIKDVEHIGAILTSKYCLEVSPEYSWHSVEMQLKPLEVECGNGQIIELTGRMDGAQVRRNFSLGYGIVDRKTGQRAVGTDGRAVTKGHGAQLGIYELLFEYTVGESATMPAEIIGMQTSKVPRIGIGHVYNAKEMIVGTSDTTGLLDYAADTLKTGMFRPNPASRLCSERFCPRWSQCRFHE